LAHIIYIYRTSALNCHDAWYFWILHNIFYKLNLKFFAIVTFNVTCSKLRWNTFWNYWWILPTFVPQLVLIYIILSTIHIGFGFSENKIHGIILKKEKESQTNKTLMVKCWSLGQHSSISSNQFNLLGQDVVESNFSSMSVRLWNMGSLVRHLHLHCMNYTRHIIRHAYKE
jgi:hypothetical protein